MGLPRSLPLAIALCACRAQSSAPPAPVVLPAPSASAPATSAPAVDPFRPLPGAALEIVTRLPAYDAQSSGGRIVVVDPDLRTARGVALETGKERWATPLALEQIGRATSYPSFGPKKRLVLHVADALVALDPESGAIVGRHHAWWNEKVWLQELRGACTLGGECDYRLVHCDDAQPYGPHFRVTITHLYHDLGKPHDNVCWGPKFLLGRAGAVIIAVTDGREWESPGVDRSEGPITVGVDAKSGAVVWTSRAIGCARCVSEASGASPDGSACWLTGTDGKLAVFSCASGKSLFHKTYGEQQLASGAPELFATWVDGGLFVSAADAASLLDAKTGKPRWSVTLPPGGLALPLATKLDLDYSSLWRARKVLLLDPKTGKEAARFDLPEYTGLSQSADLGLRVPGKLAFDAKGLKRAFVEEVPLFALDRERSPRRLLTGDGATPLAEIATDAAIVESARTESADQLALYVWGRPGAPGEVLFARRPRAP
ncbi:MAG: PQQ-binding-like beta-propeller repeat protein [Deltaproteobacteria bacterium]|nr:PQQ-binding-like beta-propeller repeat protein [Deltaproteobacteria bacterium]